jgi:hypothetical protein
MRRSLGIYDFAPDPSEFPYLRGKFSFLFYQCSFIKYSNLNKDSLLYRYGGQFDDAWAGESRRHKVSVHADFFGGFPLE